MRGTLPGCARAVSGEVAAASSHLPCIKAGKPPTFTPVRESSGEFPVKGAAVSWSFNDRQDERWALIRREDAPNKNLAIFVHGFRGTHLTTWGELPDFLKHHAGAESPLKEWDYLFIGYETYSIKNYLNIADIITKTGSRAGRSIWLTWIRSDRPEILRATVISPPTEPARRVRSGGSLTGRFSKTPIM
jgi:hypothetical protein